MVTINDHTKASDRLALLQTRLDQVSTQIADARAAGAHSWAQQLEALYMRNKKIFDQQQRVVMELTDLLKRQADFIEDAKKPKAKS